MLNTVVNPMLNLLGGGGNRGNQYIQIGGTFNSLVGTLTPMVCGALIGDIMANTPISNVNPVLFTAMAVFAATFVILSFIPIADPEGSTSQTKFERSPWAFRHFTMGVIAIFIYVGVEVGTPGILMSYLANTTDVGGGLTVNAMATAGFVSGTYWFMMLVGRFVFGTLLGGKISSKMLLTCASTVGIILVLLAIFISKDVKTSMPVFTGSGFDMATVPISALFLVLVGLCTSIMWGGIFNLAVEGLGKYTAQASGIFMMMVVGGGILPLVQGGIADLAGYMPSYWLIIAGLAYMLYYAVAGCKIVNTDIPV
jgi:FHS family L-fucose permease-like MFS transporter